MSDHKSASFFHLNAYLSRYGRFKIFHKYIDFWCNIWLITNQRSISTDIIFQKEISIFFKCIFLVEIIFLSFVLRIVLVFDSFWYITWSKSLSFWSLFTNINWFSKVPNSKKKVILYVNLFMSKLHNFEFCRNYTKMTQRCYYPKII